MAREATRTTAAPAAICERDLQSEKDYAVVVFYNAPAGETEFAEKLGGLYQGRPNRQPAVKLFRTARLASGSGTRVDFVGF